jgi:AcrR family transcriptional regulator
MRADLLREAATLLASDGPAGLTVRRVADAAGTSTAAVYDLFGDKTALVRALFAAGFRAFQARIDRLEPTADPLADLHALAYAFRENARANPHVYDLMFACPFPEFRPTDDEAARAGATFIALVERVQRAIDAGALAGRADDVAAVLFAHVHGLASLELRGWLGDPARADELWDQSLRAITDGLAPGPVSAASGGAPGTRPGASRRRG